MNYFIHMCAIVLFLILLTCNDRITDPRIENNEPDSILVNAYGIEDRFEIATWNLLNYPTAGNTTIDKLAVLIDNLDIDMIAVQEVGSISAFDSLLSKLPGWNGRLSPDVYSPGNYQKTGIIYKSGFISVSKNISLTINDTTENGSWAFPRPPLSAFVQVKDKNRTIYEFNLIVLHMKAYGDPESEARRALACELLHNYINAEISGGSDPDFIILGDWNDELDDPESSNVFLPFLNDSSNYLFLTNQIVDEVSYISSSFQSMIDHILITKDSFEEFGTGEISVLYLDEEYQSYTQYISDHRPVMAVFKGIRLDLDF